MYLTRNQAYAQAYRGFESHPLRHFSLMFQPIGSPSNEFEARGGSFLSPANPGAFGRGDTYRQPARVFETRAAGSPSRSVGRAHLHRAIAHRPRWRLGSRLEPALHTMSRSSDVRMTSDRKASAPPLRCDAIRVDRLITYVALSMRCLRVRVDEQDVGPFPSGLELQVALALIEL
jgi:hypothetical protein